MGTCFCALVSNLLAFVFLLAYLPSQTESRAHRKVHNLALYPERHSWCQATPIRQEVAHAPECEPVTIDNVVCLGACFSYSVPRAQDYEPIAPYCDKCDKTTSSWTVVTLNCTKAITGEHYQMTRNVEMISNCSCVDCNDNSLRKKSSTSTEDNIDSQEEEGGGGDGNDLDEADSEVEDDVDDSLASIPTLHKLKSVSAEMQELHSKADEEAMIQDNKIPSDDDHDHDSTRKERERQRALAADHDL